MERELKARHCYQGLVLPQVILPPKGRQDYLSGNFENCATWSGMYLAGQVWRWRLTGDPAAKRSADETLDALLFLETVTGHPGYVARGYKPAQGPSPDEEMFPIAAWHQSGPYRWLGDVSKDQAAGGKLFGFCTYYDLMDDAARKRLIAESVGRCFTRVVEDGMRIVDIASGDYRVLYAQHSGELEFAVQALFAMKAAHHITGADLFEAKYRDLLRQGYHQITVEGAARKNNHGPGYGGLHHADTHLAFKGLYYLLKYEADPAVRRYYRRSVERNFGAVQTERNAFYCFVYQSAFDDCGDDEGAIQSLHEIPVDRVVRPVKNSHRTDFDPTYPLPVYERPASEWYWSEDAYALDGHEDADGSQEHSTADFLAGYWMGRYHGFIEAEE